MNETNEQKLATTLDGTNIIVSAGAGAGKTTVLTKRVINKLLKGTKINELIILTFTELAAKEMKDRIRAKIEEYPSLKDNLNLLDTAYITTFDSYTLSLVKKYHYLLNISKKIDIINDNDISIIKNKILEEVMDEKYEENDNDFRKLIKYLTTKNDTFLKEGILRIIKSLDLKTNRDEIIDNYFNNYLSDAKIDEYIKEYTNIILNEIKNIESNIICLENTSYETFYNNMVSLYNNLINAKTYDEIRRSIPTEAIKRPPNSEDIKDIKDSIDNSLELIKKYVRFNTIEDIKESFNKSKEYIKCILDIIKRYYIKINKYKYNNDLYEFTDIELMAIKILKNNKEICDEIKYNTNEILIDEYQDTNDIQEEFVSLISNNNIYMVGDIKQSIYGFRNANPSIFKDKYNNYSNSNGGIKIDLLHNFRSREEVLSNINEIFSLVMDLNIGGSNYKENGIMLFDNDTYRKNKTSQNYNMDIINYKYEDNIFTKEEIEAFIIGKDIKNKINNKYQVLDRNKLRNCTYEDFCIIMDRGTSFPLYKKIFEYLGIPLAIYEDKELTNGLEIMLLNNIIGLIIKINNQEYDIDFKYNLISVLRSYLYEYDDNTIFNIIKDKTYKELDLYNKCINICNSINILNSYELLIRIIDDFNFYKNIIKVGNIEDSIIRINNLIDIAKNLSNIGYTINDFKDYLDEMIKGKNKITYKGSLAKSNSVKIMNIHKSKGLQFNICYYPYLYKEFNKEDIKDRYIFDNKYGLIIPYFDDGITFPITKELFKNKYILNDISERIRLLYVALTRCKEKMILITSLDDNYNHVNGLVDYNIRSKYNSFLDIFNSIKDNLRKYIYNVDINKIGITKDYLYGSFKEEINNNSNVIINYHNINVENELIENKHASKEINKLITKSEKELLEYGIKIHKLFETEDFLTSNNKYINNLVNKLNINNNTLIYKEHEFIYEDDNIYHGIIDLLLIEENTIKIIDYKLKNISDIKYKEQLKVYYNYINKVLNKDNNKIIEVYLYSILDNVLNKVNI